MLRNKNSLHFWIIVTLIDACILTHTEAHIIALFFLVIAVIFIYRLGNIIEAEKIAQKEGISLNEYMDKKEEIDYDDDDYFDDFI